VTTATAAHPTDFDPGRIEERTYATRGRRYLLDTTALVNFMIVVLFLIPAELVMPQLTAVGRPALVLGLVLCGLWVMSRLHPELVMHGRQPIRWALTVWLLSLLASYAAAQFRGLTVLEANGADRSMIYALVFIGVALACADGIPTRRRFDDIVRILVWSATAMALIGIAQSTLQFQIADYMHIPGLVLHTDPVGFEDRRGFTRIASTTAHYIEFSAVMALALPFALHLARFGVTSLVRQLATISSLIIAISIPLTVSRTGILGLLVVAVVMLPAWRWRTRLNLMVMMFGLLAFVMLIRPRLLGSLKGMFTNWSRDESIQGRTDDYAQVYSFFMERPWLGRGTGTLIPELYLILDNQWLAALVQNGVFGVVALAGLSLTAIWLALRVRRNATSEQDRHLASCLIAVQVLVIVCSATFDTFAFTTFTTSFAVCVGLSGALWRLTHPARALRTNRPRHRSERMATRAGYRQRRAGALSQV
jgi:O-antigen ligase